MKKQVDDLQKEVDNVQKEKDKVQKEKDNMQKEKDNMQKEKISLVELLLSTNTPIEKIMEVTKLSLEEIKNLRSLK